CQLCTITFSHQNIVNHCFAPPGFIRDLLCFALVEHCVCNYQIHGTSKLQKGLKVNMGKTKVMNCMVVQGQAENSGKFSCGICNKGVGRNSIYCTKCKKWIHKKCSMIRSRLETVVGFQCTNFSQGLVAETISKKLCPIKLNGDSLECVDKFCYFGDMIGSGGGAEY